MSENPATQLDHEEMISQMAVLTLGGHETTANTVTWLLWELSKSPQYQERLRAEIRHKRAEITMRGDTDFNMEDFEGMAYLQAAIKVSNLLFCSSSTQHYLRHVVGNSADTPDRLSFAPYGRPGRHHPSL